MSEKTHPAFIRMKNLGDYLGIGKSTPYTWLDQKSPQYDPTFPRPVKLGPRATGIPRAALDEWISQRIHHSTSQVA